MPQLNAFLVAEAELERERLSALLTITATGAQGTSDAISRLQRELHRED